MKKGFELSINFIIVMILSILILGFGFSIFTKMFTIGGETIDAWDEAKKNRVQELLGPNTPVALAENVKTIRAGKKYVFGLAISNYGESANFNVSVGSDNFPVEALPTIRYDVNIFPIEARESKFVSFLVALPGNVPKGSYILTVNVSNTDTEELYDPPGKKVYINVP